MRRQRLALTPKHFPRAPGLWHRSNARCEKREQRRCVETALVPTGGGVACVAEGGVERVDVAAGQDPQRACNPRQAPSTREDGAGAQLSREKIFV